MTSEVDFLDHGAFIPLFKKENPRRWWRCSRASLSICNYRLPSPLLPWQQQLLSEFGNAMSKKQRARPWQQLEQRWSTIFKKHLSSCCFSLCSRQSRQFLREKEEQKTVRKFESQLLTLEMFNHYVFRHRYYLFMSTSKLSWICTNWFIHTWAFVLQ